MLRRVRLTCSESMSDSPAREMPLSKHRRTLYNVLYTTCLEASGEAAAKRSQSRGRQPLKERFFPGATEAFQMRWRVCSQQRKAKLRPLNARCLPQRDWCFGAAAF